MAPNSERLFFVVRGLDYILFGRQELPVRRVIYRMRVIGFILLRKFKRCTNAAVY